MTRAGAALLLAATLGACAGGSETGNPAVPMPVGLGLRSSDPQAVTVSTGGSSGTGATRIDEAWVSFGELDFLRDAECDAIDEVGQRGGSLVVADLASLEAEVTIELVPGTYCGLVAPLERITENVPAEAPATLEDHSLVVRGARGDGVELVLEFPEQDELELLAIDGSFTVEEGQRLLMAFDVATWLDGVELNSAELETDGSIRIDSATNTPLLDAFELNVECSLNLYLDADEDGELDPGSDPLLAGCAPN